MTETAIFFGGPGQLPPERHPTGFYKVRIQEPVTVGREGLVGDHQADRRVHGGPDRAVNHYPADHLPAWQAAYPAAAERFVPGAFGENLSTLGWLERNVAIGDRFALGDCLLEVAQPRFPCWKVDRRFDCNQLARAMMESGRSGWLYRVIEPGTIRDGDRLERVARHPAQLTVDELWDLHREPRASMERMGLAAELPELAAAWRDRFSQRLEWLRRQRNASDDGTDGTRGTR